jgi:PAS domain S-box-containing protein
MKNRLLILIFVLCTNNVFASEIELTKEEKEYLNNNPITYAGDPNWLPFEAFDKKGNYIGIIAEYIEILEKKLNKKFDKTITNHWLDTLELSKRREVDIISGNAADAVLNRNYKPIDIYLKNHLVIVTRKDHKFISDLNHIKDKKIAFTAGGGYTADILKKYPDIEFLKSETPQAGLLEVEMGKYDAFIGSLSMVDYTIAQMAIEGIKIAGQTDIMMNITLFVDKEKPLLYSILNKTMKTISKDKRHEIILKWRSNKVKSVIDYTLVWQISIFFLILFLTGLLFMLFLKRSNKKLHQLLNSTIDAIGIFKDGKLIDCNDVLLELYGYNSLNEIKNKKISDFVHKDHHQFLKNQLKDSQKPYEMNLIKRDGTIFPALIKGINLEDGKTRISTIIDLTKLKQTEQQNLYLSERIKLAFDGSRDGLWDWDLMDNSVYFSPRWKEMLGYTDDELENNFDTWQLRVHPDDLDNVLNDIELSIQDKEKVYENKHRLRHKDGHWVWIYDRGKVQRDIDGKAIRMIGTHTDLTTEINLSNELSELNQTLKLRVKKEVEKNCEQEHIIMRKNRLAEMGEMLSSIAHQWRQPLNRINSNVAALRSVLRRDPIDHEMIVSQTEMIEKNTKYMSDTIEDFANFFHPEKKETQFLLQDVTGKALELMGLRTQNAEINIVSDKDIEVSSFEKEYLQVILIILNNAIDNFEFKATQDPKIDIFIKEHDGIAHLSICDNGGGIEEKDIDRIFDPYYTTKFAKEGTGLGLYVAKIMIEKSMQGQLQVKNKNGGACFELLTPGEINA